MVELRWLVADSTNGRAIAELFSAHGANVVIGRKLEEVRSHVLNKLFPEIGQFSIDHCTSPDVVTARTDCM